MKIQIDGIILAAGLSSRMKEWKPEIKIENIPIIIRSIKPMLEHCRKVIVVGGYNYGSLHRIILEENYFSESQIDKLVLVENKNYLSGMFSSVKTGLANTGDVNAIFISPGDIPFIKSSTYSTLVKNLSADSQNAVFVPITNLQREDSLAADLIRKGHPVLIKKEIADLVISYPDNTNLRDVLEEFQGRLCPVNDQGIFTDIDNKIDLERARIFINMIK